MENTENTKIEYFICDIDGTIADCSHRIGLIQGSHKDYDKFFSLCHLDKPITETIKVIDCLRKQYIVLFVSGRSEACREQTFNWLNTYLDDYVGTYDLFMRPAGDTRPDYLVKQEILDKIRIRMGGDPLACFDDRPQVIEKLWRKQNIPVFKVGTWDKEEEGRIVRKINPGMGNLVLMVGPAGAGKSTILSKNYHETFGFWDQTEVVSTDNLRQHMTGDFKDQSKNTEVFEYLHRLVELRSEYGLRTIVDATNLRGKDRKSLIKAAGNAVVEYWVVDTSLTEILKNKGWRSEELCIKMYTRYKDNLKNIMSGDGNPDVIVKTVKR